MSGILPDEAVEDFFKIAVEALEKEDELVRGGMQEARQQNNFYAERRLGLASQREEGAGWTIFRAMLRLNYPARHAVEVLWEERYPDGRRADFIFRLRDSGGAMRVAACVELKWGDYRPIVISNDIAKMRANYPGSEVRKFVLNYGLEGREQLIDMPQALGRLELRTGPAWYGPPGDRQEGRLYIALAEALDSPSC